MFASNLSLMHWDRTSDVVLNLQIEEERTEQNDHREHDIFVSEVLEVADQCGPQPAEVNEQPQKQPPGAERPHAWFHMTGIHPKLRQYHYPENRHHQETEVYHSLGAAGPPIDRIHP